MANEIETNRFHVEQDVILKEMIDLCTDSEGYTYYFSIKDFFFHRINADGYEDADLSGRTNGTYIDSPQKELLTKLIVNKLRGIDGTEYDDLSNCFRPGVDMESTLKWHTHKINKKFYDINHNVVKNPPIIKEFKSKLAIRKLDGSIRFKSDNLTDDEGKIIYIKKKKVYINSAFCDEIKDKWRELYPDSITTSMTEELYGITWFGSEPADLYDEVYYEISDIRDMIPDETAKLTDSTAIKMDISEPIMENSKYFVEAGEYRYAMIRKKGRFPITVGHIEFKNHSRTADDDGYEIIEGIINFDFNASNSITDNCLWVFNITDYYAYQNRGTCLNLLDDEYETFTITWNNQVYDFCFAIVAGTSDTYINAPGNRCASICYKVRVPEGYDGIVVWASIYYNPGEPRKDDIKPIVSVVSRNNLSACKGLILYHCN